VSSAVAALLASGAYLVPMLLSRSSSPTPDHPRILLWYRLLRKPSYKPPDPAIPLAWTLIESGLAVAAYRLLRRPSGAPRNQALGWLAVSIAGIGGWSRLFFGRAACRRALSRQPRCWARPRLSSARQEGRTGSPRWRPCLSSAGLPSRRSSQPTSGAATADAGDDAVSEPARCGEFVLGLVDIRTTGAVQHSIATSQLPSPWQGDPKRLR